jgi:V8-like Glu-specific endopeptidase
MSPTEGGSSGSPAFDSVWQVIALHHAGGTHMSKLNGKGGTYPANEGIWIQSICRAARASAKDGEVWRSA